MRGLLLLGLVALAACGERENFRIYDPELRPPLGGRDVGAVYMEFQNFAFDLALVRAESPEASVIEMHETTRNEAGVASMEKLDRIDIPYGERTVLEKGGLHLMVFGLTAEEAEDGIELTLTFDDGSETTLTVRPKADDEADEASGDAAGSGD